MVTSETLAIFRKLTCGSYEKADDTNESPTKTNVAIAMPSFRSDGLTKKALISQNNNASDHAVCVAAIDTGADRASRNNDALSAHSIFLLTLDGCGISESNGFQNHKLKRYEFKDR